MYRVEVSGSNPAFAHIFLPGFFFALSFLNVLAVHEKCKEHGGLHTSSLFLLLFVPRVSLSPYKHTAEILSVHCLLPLLSRSKQ